MRALSALIAFSFLLLNQTQAEERLFTQWTIELPKTRMSLEWYQTYRVGGMGRDSESFYIPSPQNTLQKRRLSHGTIVWETPLEANSQGAWSVDETQVYGGDTKGNLYGLDKLTGKINWRAKTKGVFFAAPLLEGEFLWVMNSLGTLQCYNKNSGEWVWQQADPSVSSVSLWSAFSAVKLGDEIIAGFPSALLQSFQASTGQALWKESFSANLGAADSINDLKSVALADNNVVIASSYGGDLKAWALKKGDRKLLWQKPLSLYSPATVDRAKNIVYASARDGAVYALDATSGFLRWKRELPKGLATSVSLSNHGLWVAGSEGNVYFLSPEGEILSQSSDYQSAIWNAPLVIDQERAAIVLTAQGILRKVYWSPVAR